MEYSIKAYFHIFFALWLLCFICCGLATIVLSKWFEKYSTKKYIVFLLVISLVYSVILTILTFLTKSV